VLPAPTIPLQANLLASRVLQAASQTRSPRLVPHRARLAVLVNILRHRHKHANRVLLVPTILLQVKLLANRVLLVPTVLLLDYLHASSVLPAPTIPFQAIPLANRVLLATSLCKVLPFALLRVLATRPCHLVLRVHVRQAITTRKAHVCFVLQGA